MKISQLVEKQSDVLSQKQMIKLFEANKDNTSGYEKIGNYNARLGKVGEKIITTIDGEDETVNTVKDGDVVVQGPKDELYVLSSKKFNERYHVNTPLTHSFQKYKAKGLIRAYEHKDKSFKFLASWNEEMLCNEGDFLAAPFDNKHWTTPEEVYRIEHDVFHLTYKKL